MHVCLIKGSVPPVTGGGGVSVMNLAFGLVRNGITVSLLSANEPLPTLVEAIRRSGGRHQAIDPPSADAVSNRSVDWLPMVTFGHAEKAYRFLQDTAPDIVHVCDHSSAILACLLAADRPTPLLVATFHEVSVEDSPEGRARARFCYELPRVNCFVAVSDYYFETATTHGLTAPRLRRARQGIETAVFAAGVRRRGRSFLAVSDDDCLVLCPGRASPRKGLEHLLNALTLCKDGGFSPTAVFATSLNGGSIQQVQRLTTAIQESGLEETCSIVFDVPYSTMPDLYAAADMVVQPSDFEGLGLVGLEAMAAGTPLIATETHGFREYCHDGINCLTFPPKRADLLSARIRTLAMEPDLVRGLVRAARQTAASYDVAYQALDHIAIYQELITTQHVGLRRED